MPLPALLAGPILRRVTPREVCVWLATSVEAQVTVEVGRPGPGGLADRLATGEAVTASLGPRLHVHLARARAPQPLPVGELLSYRVRARTEQGPDKGEPAALADLAGLGLAGGASSIAYGDQPLPGFVLPAPEAPLRVLHGSCRLLHGAGPDAFRHADDHLATVHADVAQRPQALLLTGDQIYGDEVGGPIIGHLGALGSALLGPGDARSVPGVGDLGAVAPYGRQALAQDRAGFTSRKAANHLLSLGEYAAAYLVAWNEALWPERLPDPDEVGLTAGSAIETARVRRQFRTEARALEAARRALPAVRRVLANVPTYMVFDDHEVTDDWNITRDWCERVSASPTGRRVVANALAAFWAFQAWGNEPDAFDQAFLSAVTDGARAIGSGPDGGQATADGDADATADATAYEDTLWRFDRWTYLAPTTRPVVVLDTRTRRQFDSGDGAARLLGDDELARIADLSRQALAERGEPLVLVSPVPLFGLELQERRQKFLAGKVGPYEIDFEAWHSNLEGFVQLMRVLIDELGVTRCVVLSGDVHYGLNVDASFASNGDELRIAQLVSSSLKHSGRLARTFLHLLGRTVRAEQARVGWDEPPAVETRPGLAALVDPLLARSVNSDEWRDNAPVFLRESLAERVDGDEPTYRERRRYVGPAQRPDWYVVGDNNIGLVTIDGSTVTHHLLVSTARDGLVRAWDATIDLDRPWTPDGR